MQCDGKTNFVASIFVHFLFVTLRITPPIDLISLSYPSKQYQQYEQWFAFNISIERPSERASERDRETDGLGKKKEERKSNKLVRSRCGFRCFSINLLVASRFGIH